MATFRIKQHDRRPAAQTVLGYDGTDEVPDLTGTVHFIMRRKDSTGPPKINAPATVVDAASGVVRFDWRLGDTDEVGDDWVAEWEHTDPDGLTQTFPTDSYDDVVIYADLDGAP